MKFLKNLSLVKKFAIYSLIAYLVFAVGLSTFIARHIETDAIYEKLEIFQFALDASTNKSQPYSTQENLPDPVQQAETLNNIIRNLNTLGVPEYYIWDKDGLLLHTSTGNLTNKTSLLKIDTSLFTNVKSPNYQVLKKSATNEKKLNIEASIQFGLPISTYHVKGIFPYHDIELHISQLIKTIAYIFIGGLLLLYFLLLRIIINASKELILQKSDLNLKNQELQRAYEQLNLAFYSTVRALSDAVDARDSYTAGHSSRVMNYSELIGKAMNMSEEQLERLKLSALLHDIGKVGIEDSVLLKPNRLTVEEFNVIKTHPDIGINILENIAAFHDLLPSIRHHHERYDGKGYPSQLKAGDIPYDARIIAIADSFDAMTSDRPYKVSLDFDEAIQEIINNSGTQFDPEIAASFVEFMTLVQNKT